MRSEWSVGGLRGWLRATGELVLPRECAGCAALGTWWCDRCARAFAPGPRAVPVVEQPSLTVSCAAPYRGAVGSALVAFKERGTAALVGPLAGGLARAVEHSVPELSAPLALVPAPSRPAAVRARGADVVAELARECARRVGHGDVRVVRCLSYARSVLDQTVLDPEGRAANVRGALRVRPVAVPLLAGRVVVVVDDVLTTGSTLVESARALREATGTDVAAGATVAAAGAFASVFVGPSEHESVERVVVRGEDG